MPCGNVEVGLAMRGSDCRQVEVLGVGAIPNGPGCRSGEGAPSPEAKAATALWYALRSSWGDADLPVVSSAVGTSHGSQ